MFKFKKIFLLGLALSLITGVSISMLSPQKVEATDTFLWGDVNKDGVAGGVDAGLILQYTAGQITEFSGYPGVNAGDVVAADLNGDGVVDKIDSDLLLEYDVFLITQFPVDTNGDGYGPEEAITGCTETDGGQDYYTKGSTKYGAITHFDYCTNCIGSDCSSINEYYCGPTGTLSRNHICAYGCDNEVCLTEVVENRDITVSNVQVSNLTQSSATITWTSNEDGDSQFRYGESMAEVSYAQWQVAEFYQVGKTSHTAQLSNLKADTVYVYEVKTTNANIGDAIKYQGVFTTGADGVDQVTVSNIQVSNITHNSANVSWKSNVAGSAEVRYSTSTESLADWDLVSFFRSGITSYSTTISGLESNTYYVFEVKSGNAGVGESIPGRGNFTTLASSENPDLTITNVKVSNKTTSSAVVTWDTNFPSNSDVHYYYPQIGTKQYENWNWDKIDDYTQTNHSITLTGLRAGTTYYYEVSSKRESGSIKTTSETKNFTTTQTEGKPDLIIQDIYYEDGLLKVKYCNNGTGTQSIESGVFYIKMTANGITFSGKPEPSGVLRRGNYPFQVPAVGECLSTDGYPEDYFETDDYKEFTGQFETEIDWENTISELNEDNNTFTKTITIPVRVQPVDYNNVTNYHLEPLPPLLGPDYKEWAIVDASKHNLINPALTKYKYSGIVEVEMDGIIQASGTSLSDAYYIYTDYNGNKVTPFKANKFGLHVNGRRLQDIWPQPYIAGSQYIFKLDLGNTPQQIKFAIGDTWVMDNKGAFKIAVREPTPVTNKPDFIISDIKIEQRSGDVGKYIYVTIKNSGGRALPSNKIVSISVKDLDTGDIYSSGITDDFISGYTKEVSSAPVIKEKSSDTYRVEATVDVNNVYEESNENNNTFTKIIAITSQVVCPAVVCDLKTCPHGCTIDKDGCVTSQCRSLFGPSIPAISCEDSDGGKNYYERSYIKVQYKDGLVSKYSDSCNPHEGPTGQVWEYYCGKDNLPEIEKYECPDGCGNGACKRECGQEGEFIALVPNAPTCCAGLTLIPPKDANIAGSLGICTAKCGNGTCDVQTETEYNCPVDCGSSPPAETLTVDFNKNNFWQPAITKYIYQGEVEITVKGMGQDSGSSLSDAYYIYTDYDGNVVTPFDAREFSLHVDGKRVDKIWPQPYRSDHVYTFKINTGVSGRSIKFAINDNFTVDNSGSFTINIKGIGVGLTSEEYRLKNISIKQPVTTSTVISDKIDRLTLMLERTISELESQIVELEKKLVKAVDEALTKRLKGKILLQVEENGEAWYVDPQSENKLYMKDGTAAYDIMRALGLGITNADLEKIPIGIQEKLFELKDTDGDGIPDNVEIAIGTDKNNADSDGDGFRDKTEILSGYKPNGADKYIYDNSLTDRLVGRIALQVESHGEAWYINPSDKKRYYLGDPATAYSVMRFLSLGITNDDLRKIQVGEFEEE